jgi:hypothetical protein
MLDDLLDAIAVDEEIVLVSTPYSVVDGKVSINLQVALDEAGIAKHLDYPGPIRNLARTAFDIIVLFA